MEFLDRLHKAGIRIRVDGDQLIATPKASITAELREEMRSHKSELLTALSWGYTPADLKEMDKLLRELAHMEGWSDQELDARLSERQRMAPVNVPKTLGALRLAVRAELAQWPEKPANRAVVVLCELCK